MLEEMGEPYQLMEKTTRTDELQTAEYLRLNPNARIPTLVDGEVVLWEFMAINLYLAQKYEGPMHCVSPKVLGLAAQWSFWAMLIALEPVAEVRRTNEFDNAFLTIASACPHALAVLADRFLMAHRSSIVEFAAANQLPSMYPYGCWRTHIVRAEQH
jgi:glutathione S-transferase